MKDAYIASPLGFTHSTIEFYSNFLDKIRHHVHVLDPWNVDLSEEIARIEQIDDYWTRIEAWSELSKELGRNNVHDIDKADIVIAILEGTDVDSGTASEIGYAAARGKTIYGIREDIRMAGDNPGCDVNLQVEYFIRSSGGTIFTSYDEFYTFVESVGL